MNRKYIAAVLYITFVTPCAEDPKPEPAAPQEEEQEQLYREPPESPEPESSEYKGYRAMNQLVTRRIVKAPARFEMSQYLGPTGFELTELLGSWGGDGIQNSFRNGKPNALSFLVYRMMFDELGADLAGTCPPATTPEPPALELHDRFRAALEPLCEWPGANARNPEAIQKVWEAMISYDAPIEEMNAWRDHFMSETYANAAPDNVIKSMISAALLNPYVLLQN